jgi:hypothetical protein
MGMGVDEVRVVKVICMRKVSRSRQRATHFDRTLRVWNRQAFWIVSSVAGIPATLWIVLDPIERGLQLQIHAGNASVERAFELMEQYADQPMDLADASLVVAGGAMETQPVFTIDRRNLETYPLKRGHRHVMFEPVT